MSDDINLITTKMSEIMLKSEYDKVIFHDIAESYPTDGHIQFQYSLTENVIPSEGDLVALFKVGWEAPHLYLQAEKAVIPEENDISTKHCILFKAEYMPKDDGIFYQFCYICADGIVRGASTPFRFRGPTTEELVEVEDTDSDLLVIRTRTAVIEEKLWEMAVKNRDLLKFKANIEKELKEEKIQSKAAEENLIACKEELNQAKEELKQAKEELQSLVEKHEKKMNKLQDALELEQKRVTNDMLELKNEMTQNEAYIEELRATIKLFSVEKENAISNLIHATKQIEVLQKQVDATDLQLQSIAGKNEKLIQTVAAEQGQTHKLQQQIQKLQQQLCDEQQKYDELENKRASVELEKNELSSRITDMEHMLTAMEKSKLMATEELVVHSENAKKLAKEMKDKFDQISYFRASCARKDAEKYDLKKRMVELEKQHALISESYEAAKTEVEEFIVAKKVWQEEKDTLITAVDDLKVRLQAGATEYQAKYIECIKLEKKLAKIKKRTKEQTSLTESAAHQRDVDNSNQEIASQCDSAEQTDAKLYSTTDANQIQYENMLIAKDITIQSLQQQLQAVTTLIRNLPSGCHPFVNGAYPVQPPQAYAGFPWGVSHMMANPAVYYSTSSPSSLPSDVHTPTTPPANTSQTSVATPGTHADQLPPPIQPEITALAKLAAITAVTKHFTESQISTEVAVTHPSVGNLETVNAEDDVEPDSSEQIHAPDLLSISMPNKCPVCDVCFSDLPTLQDHIEIHFGQECPVCSHAFGPDQLEALEAHISSHFEHEQHYTLTFD